MRIALERATVLYLLWLVLIRSLAPLDLAVGAVAVALATAWSLRLLPAAASKVELTTLSARLPRFLWQSTRAGIDVALRAFAPRPRLAPGLLLYPTAIPRGHARNTFAAITSLVPGTVPVDDRADGIEYHCLDTTQPVRDDLAAEERVYAPALGLRAPDA